ncbi:hypothetical protein [Methylomonas fluvii]|nr:hypothetical protein [Methylomonas fluvii]
MDRQTFNRSTIGKGTDNSEYADYWRLLVVVNANLPPMFRKINRHFFIFQ